MIRVDEFVHGYMSSASIESQLNNFIEGAKISRQKLIDIKYAMAFDSGDNMKHSALLIWDDEK